VKHLSAASIRKGLATEHLGRSLVFYETCTSTNDLALDLLAEGAPHGTLVVADRQTEGRGQRGRVWHSPPGTSIHASLVLRSESPVASPTLLVAAMGLGLAEGIEAAVGVDVGIKWPNDLWCDGRKVAGILVEARGFRTESPAFVAGFGVNVNQRADEFPPELRAVATSLAVRTGRRHDRAAVLRASLAALEPRVEMALAGRGTSELHEAYRRRSVLLGRRVTLLDADVPVEGFVADLSATDGLLLRTDDGRHRHVLAEHARDVRPVG
jgi:BirA family transcriptional regulator, biotin operon repressor / biotin---[acetyl-CoA-carboxylase] ligase